MSNYECAVEIRKAIMELARVLRDLFDTSRNIDYCSATCGECAWRIGDWKLHEKSQRWGLCRRVTFSGGQEEIGKIKLDEPACPAFIRRPEHE